MDLTVSVAAAVVVTDECLVSEQGSQQLSLIVFQTTMPHTISQLEQQLEPFVKWFHRMTSPAVGRSAPLALQVSLPQKTPPMGLVARFRRLVFPLRLRAATVLRTEETPAGPFSFVGPFDAFPQVIAVVTVLLQSEMENLVRAG